MVKKDKEAGSQGRSGHDLETNVVNPINASQENDESRGSLWDQAYKDLRAEKKELVDDFEKLLMSEPEIERITSLEDGHPAKREKQMSGLVDKKLAAMKEEQWKIKIGGKSIEVRQQVDRIVKVVLVGKDFITSVAHIDPIHAGLPWAGLLTKDNEQRTAATDGLEYISRLIRRYTELEQIYLRDEDLTLKTDLEGSILKIYKHILEYEARAACQFNRNTASQWARNVVEADSWKGILESIKELEAACDKLTWVIDAKDQRVRTSRLESFLESQNHEVKELLRASRTQDEEHGKLQLAELKAGREEQKDWHRNAEESACLECLRTTDYESNKNKNPHRIPGTCEWFLRNERYKRWLVEQGSTWLWVTADPGCGKSVLSRFLVDEYKSKRSMDTQSVCYYFFKDDSEENRSATHALCAILHQLCSQNNSLLRNAIPEYRRNGNKLPQLFNELWGILLSAAADPDAGSVICILDGLDECAESTRLPIIRELASFYQNPGITTRLKFIVISRPYTSIGDAFCEENPNVASVQLMGESKKEMEEIRVEIDLVIKEKVKHFDSLRRRRGVDDETHVAVQEQLNSFENRTYLWVSLIFPELEKNAGLAKSKLLQLIRSIPRSVEEAYERILNQSSDRDQAKKLLHIVAAAKRPLNLAEMNIALSIEEGSNSIEDLGLVPESSFQTIVRELCGLFVTIRDSKVYLIHQTAKEFLVSEGTSPHLPSVSSGLELWKHSLEPVESSQVLAEICIRYLLFTVFESHPLALNHDTFITEQQRELNIYLKKHQFLDYAANYWSSHLREAKSSDDPATLKATLTICASHSKRLWTWYNLFWSNDFKAPPEALTDLMVGSHLGLEMMVKSCLRNGAEVNFQAHFTEWTPLLLAVEGDHETIVKILLENGAESNAQDSYGRTALWKATSQGCEAVVKTLLEHSAESNIQDSDGCTALSVAAVWGHKVIVKTLLEHDAEPNTQDSNGQTALFIAARNGHEAVVKTLLEHSAESNTQDSDGCTALMEAARCGHEAVVKTLLRHSAESNTQDSDGCTALMEAARCGHEAIVKILLEHGAEPNTQDSDNCTALWEAARQGHEAVVKTLLDHGAESNTQDNYGCTALWAAACCGYGAVVKTLLEHGAKANTQDNYGCTALWAATSDGHEAVVKLLLEHGAEPNIQNNNGHTALWAAKNYEHEAVVKILLEHGAELS
ncbi:MAG: hypothetical protein M1830_003024 [Pleopsidium flavum]|nr:MAG: hypothetical protein M1830_003024 [Pleopsidium flavum]